MATAIATIDGVALRPGVSLNRRLYSRETIAGAVVRAQQRLADGGPPLTMMVFHGAEDDSSHIVGRITSLSLDEDGAALYTAALADTPHARTILELVDPAGDGPYLEGVSIRGFWLGEIRQVVVDGVTVETTDELELDGLDFTKSPGVAGARVNTVSRTSRGAAPSETSGGRTPIYESAEATSIRETPPLTLHELSRLTNDQFRRVAAEHFAAVLGAAETAAAHGRHLRRHDPFWWRR